MSGLSQEDQNFGGKTLCVVSGVGEHRGFYKFRPIFTKWSSFLYSLCLSFVIMKRHEDCLLYDPTCDCGPLKDHIMPPWAVYAVSKVRGEKKQQRKDTCKNLICFYSCYFISPSGGGYLSVECNSWRPHPAGQSLSKNWTLLKKTSILYL